MGESEEGLGLEAEQQLGSPSSPCASAPDLDPTSAVEKTLDEKFEKLVLDEKENTGNEMQEQEDDVMENGHEDGSVVKEVEEEETRRFQYPLRPGEPDCPFYLRTGTCRYGSNCKFNHPPRRNSQVRPSSESAESVQFYNFKGFKENGEYPERAGQPECKYYLKTGGCKFGQACRYNHPQEKSLIVPAAELNFLGLPIRLGEKECPFYMRMGSCKFGTNCRFHHPDPTAAGMSDPISGYRNGGSVPIHPGGVSQPTVPSWSLQPSNDAIPYLDAAPSYAPMMLSHHQGTHLNLGWNRYQAPVTPLYLPEGKVHPPVTSVLKDSTKNGDGSAHHYQQLPVDEFPERPDQKECQYFMKNGDCKYRSACKFHHPKNRVQKTPVLSPIGLPLRPDQIVCAHYSRYGICKYGPACKYDHPPNSGSSDHFVGSSSGHPPFIDKSAALGGPQMADTNMTLIQQPNSGSSDCPVVSY